MTATTEQELRTDVCGREGCTNTATGKSTYCSDRCRQAASRANRAKCDTIEAATVTNGTVTEQDDVTVDGPSIGHYNANPSKYAQRTNPHLLNWGKWMTCERLASLGLKANRVPIPGDWDYIEPEPEQVPRGFGQESTRARGGAGEGRGGS